MNFLILPPKTGKTRVLKGYSFNTFFDRVKSTGFFSDKSVFADDVNEPSNMGFKRFKHIVKLDRANNNGSIVQLVTSGVDEEYFYVPITYFLKDCAHELPFHDAVPIDCVEQDESFFDHLKEKGFYYDDYDYLLNHPHSTIHYNVNSIGSCYLDELNHHLMSEVFTVMQKNENAKYKYRAPVFFFRNGPSFESNFNISSTQYPTFVTHVNYFQRVTALIFKKIKDFIQIIAICVAANDKNDTCLINHNGFESIRFSGLPYIAVSEGGAYEPDNYGPVSDAPGYDVRCLNLTEFRYKFDVLVNNTIPTNKKDDSIDEPHFRYRFEFDKEKTAVYWLLNINRCFIDSLLTTIFKAADGATLKGGLSATVMELLARYNHSDGISAYTPTEHDALIEQLSSGYLNGVLFYTYDLNSTTPPKMAVTTRYMAEGRNINRDSIFYVLVNNMAIGNNLSFNFVNRSFSVCDKYSERFLATEYSTYLKSNKHTMNTTPKAAVSGNLLDVM